MRGVLKKTVSLNQFLKQTKRRAKGTKRSHVVGEKMKMKRSTLKQLLERAHRFLRSLDQ